MVPNLQKIKKAHPKISFSALNFWIYFQKAVLERASRQSVFISHLAYLRPKCQQISELKDGEFLVLCPQTHLENNHTVPAVNFSPKLLKK